MQHGGFALYSGFTKHGEAGDIRLIIASGTVIALTLILGAVGLTNGTVRAFRALA